MRSTHEYNDLTLQQLRCVVTVARVGSFGGAAAALGTTQPSVSRAVAATETTLGVTLFDRTTRRVRLRPDAHEFVERAERILADVRAAADSVREGAPAGRRLSVACLMSVACAHLPPALARFSRSHPAVRVSCVEAMQHHVEDDVERGVADIAIADVSALRTGLTGRALWSEAFHVCAPATHRLARRPEVRLRDVDPEELIAFPRHARLRVDLDRALARHHGGLRAPRIVVQQYATAFRLVEVGFGVTIIPTCMTPFAPGGTVTPRVADRGVGRTLGAIWRAGSIPPPAADDFVDALGAVVDAARR